MKSTHIIALCALVLGAGFVQAQTIITIDTLDDELNADGDCSCREAVEASRTNMPVDGCPGGSATQVDRLQFDPSLMGTINLGLGELLLSEDMVIEGPGRDLLTIDAGGASRVFNVPANVAVALRDLTISGGFGGTSYADFGGGILSDGDLTIEDCRISGSRCAAGGGIAAYGGRLEMHRTDIGGNEATGFSGGGGLYARGDDVLLFDCVLSGNLAVNGGGIMNFTSSVQLRDCEISGNTAHQGGGINNNAGGMTIDRCLVAGNEASGQMSSNDGAGIFSTAALAITNSTISGNYNLENGSGAGIMVGNWSTCVLNNATVTGNHCTLRGGGLYVFSQGTLETYSAVIAGNVADFMDADLYDSAGAATITSHGYNLIGDIDSATPTAGPGDRFGGGGSPVVDPLLDVLAANGWALRSHLPLTGSPVIDAGDCTRTGLVVDQRGLPRPVDLAGLPDVGDGCDIGAVEVQDDGSAVDDGRVPDRIGFELRGCPNPFNPAIEISFRLDVGGHAALTVHDLAGRRVRSLIDGDQEAGPGRVVWRGSGEDGRPVASGAYVLRLESGGRVDRVMVTLLR